MKLSPTISATAILLLFFPAPALAQLVPVTPFLGTSNQGLIDSVINIINALLVLAAIGAMAYIIVAGVRYFASQGDEQAVSQAKHALIYGVIGILVIVLSFSIVNFFVAQT